MELREERIGLVWSTCHILLLITYVCSHTTCNRSFSKFKTALWRRLKYLADDEIAEQILPGFHRVHNSDVNSGSSRLHANPTCQETFHTL